MKKLLLLLFSFAFYCCDAESVMTFIGKINSKFSIHMRISLSKDGAVTGNYYYTTQFKPIPLEGTLKGNLLTLNEYSGKRNIIETFKGALQKKSFTGIWMKETGTSLPFALSQKDWIAPASDNFSGTYTVSMTPQEEKAADIPQGEHGFSGSVCCMILPNGKMGFCLSYSKGYPGYHIGELMGMAVTKGNGVYEYNDKPYEDTDMKPCHILFTFKNGSLELDQQTEDSTCGFGAFVNVSETYKKSSRKFDIGLCVY